MSYDNASNMVGITDALGRTTTFGYDLQNRQVRVTNALGDSRFTTYDADGNKIAITDELGRTSRYTYDALNRLTSLTDAMGNTTRTTYDAVGNVLTKVDALGRVSRFGYDALYRQTSQTDELGKTTRYSYDALGNRLSITDPTRNVTSYTYDKLNRVLTDTNTLGFTRQFSYDAVGNLTSSTDRNGRLRTFGYDALNRQTTENWLAADGTPFCTIASTYDAVGQLTSITDPDSRYSYVYDAAGQLLQVDNQGTPNAPRVVFDYTYDLVGNRLSVSDTVNGVARGIEQFSYDALNRLTQATQSGVGVTDKRVEMSYDAASQLTSLRRFNSLAGGNPVLTSLYSYDLNGRLTGLNHQGNVALANYTSTYDAANRLTQMTGPSGTSNYNYDQRGQLLGTDHSAQTDETYGYDANGNRTNSGYQTGSNNQLLSDGVYTYTYDQEGNRTSRTNISTGEITEYVWDYRNRLTSVITRTGSTVTRRSDYTYDAFDRRIAKVVDLDGSGSQAATTERFVYDDEHIALVFDGQGNQTERYLHGPQLDQVLAVEKAGQTQWMLADHQGSVRQIADASGSVINQINYDSFGNITNQTNPSVTFRFGYTGREWDGESGQYYYRARYFDPRVGQFISQDPIGFSAGDANLYRYVGNSPTNFTDPSGEQQAPSPAPGSRPTPRPVRSPLSPGSTKPKSQVEKGPLTNPALPEILPEPSPASRPTPPPVERPVKAPSPSKECSNKGQCRAFPVPRSGGHNRHNQFATQVSGSTTDFRVVTPDGLGRNFDGLTPGTRHLWEAKTGYESVIVFDPRGLEKRNTAINADIVYQALDQVKIARVCKYNLTWAFNNPTVAYFVDSVWGGNPNYPQDVRYIRPQ